MEFLASAEECKLGPTVSVCDLEGGHCTRYVYSSLLSRE